MPRCGFFAVNGGAFPGAPGNVFYLAPDTLNWEDLGRSFSGFLEFVSTDSLEKFYEGSRWPGWEREVSMLDGNRAFSIYPFLWAKEGGPVGQRARATVPIEELWELHAIGVPLQLGLRTGPGKA